MHTEHLCCDASSPRCKFMFHYVYNDVRFGFQSTPTSFEESTILLAVVRCQSAVETSQDSIYYF